MRYRRRIMFSLNCTWRKRVETNGIACLLTIWSTVLPEKLTNPQIVNKFPAYYGTRRFITAFTTARHLPLSWARWIKSMPHPTSRRAILISSIRAWVCQVVSFPQVSPPKPCVNLASTWPAHPNVLDLWPELYLMSTEHKAPRYVVFSTSYPLF